MDVDEEPPAPLTIVIDGVAITCPVRLEIMGVLLPMLEEYMNRRTHVAEDGLAATDYFFQGDQALIIPANRRPAVGLTAEDGPDAHRFAAFFSGAFHHATNDVEDHMPWTSYRYDGHAYDDEWMEIRSNQFRTVLWNGQEMDAFGHIISQWPLDPDDNEPPNAGDDGGGDDDMDNNDGGGGGGQGSGADTGESGGWGRPRPRFCDLRPDSPDSTGAAGGESSREPNGWYRYQQNRRNYVQAYALRRAREAEQERSGTMSAIFNDSGRACTALKEHQLNFDGMPLLCRRLNDDENKAVTIAGSSLVELLRLGLADIPTGIIDDSPVADLLGLIHQYLHEE